MPKLVKRYVIKPIYDNRYWHATWESFVEYESATRFVTVEEAEKEILKTMNRMTRKMAPNIGMHAVTIQAVYDRRDINPVKATRKRKGGDQ